MNEENIKYVQTIINNDEPDLEKFSGCGGRSYVTNTSDAIDTWDTAEEAIDDGKVNYKPKVHWGVYAMDMTSRRLIKCCHNSKKKA